jgi:hypothetical protein
MVDPSLFRVVLLPLKKIIASEFGKNQKVAIFFQQVNIDQHSYQRFFQNCITSNRMFLLTFYIN